MSNELTVEANKENNNDNGSLLLGTGLLVASMIVIPAIAMKMGLGSSLTGALRIALMRASSRAANGSNDDSGAATSSFSCH